MDELKEFIVAFAEQFDDTPIEAFEAQTVFHDLDDWSSINGLAIMNMISKKYGVKILPAELRAAVTVKDVFDLVESKK